MLADYSTWSTSGSWFLWPSADTNVSRVLSIYQYQWCCIENTMYTLRTKRARPKNWALGTLITISYQFNVISCYFTWAKLRYAAMEKPFKREFILERKQVDFGPAPYQSAHISKLALPILQSPNTKHTQNLSVLIITWTRTISLAAALLQPIDGATCYTQAIYTRIHMHAWALHVSTCDVWLSAHVQQTHSCCQRLKRYFQIVLHFGLGDRHSSTLCDVRIIV